MKQCYLFNPHTEMALATDQESYTPPRRIREFEANLALLPALYAPANAAIILGDEAYRQKEQLPYYNLALRRGLNMIRFADLTPNVQIIPWGWNKALCHRLLRSGVSDELIPSEHTIKKLRELAHRATTCSFFKMMQEFVSPDRSPRFFDNYSKAVSYIKLMQEQGVGYVVKLPWSSSGRGIFCNIQPEKIAPLFSRQKGVMIEPLWDKRIDFATEWMCGYNTNAHIQSRLATAKPGNVEFVGFSLFKNHQQANYGGNIVAPQEQLKNYLTEYCESKRLEQAIEALRTAINHIIAPYYSGPIGVDMLIDRDGNINPCVEVNLRMTMGHVAIALYRNFGLSDNESYFFYPGKEYEFE